MRLYIADSNVFIQAHRAYYPLDLDVMKGFWDRIIKLSERGILRSIDKVKAEIYDHASHEDELKKWCQENLPNDFFLSTESSVENYVKIVNWVDSMKQHYTQNAIDEFLATDLADPWLVAYAMMGHDITIVTYETSEPNRKKRIKIPEVCNQFGVRYIETVEMLRELKEIT